MSKWDSLINELQRLNEIAYQIQVYSKESEESSEEYPSTNLSKEEIDIFVNDYLSWYSDCLALLPNDLKELLRTEYERNAKNFLLHPTHITSEPRQDGDTDRRWVEYSFTYSYSIFYQSYFTHRQILLEASKRQSKPTPSENIFNAIDFIERIVERFDLIARQLRKRHNNRETLTISDEYDVQNLFHTLLKLFFDDIRPEEWTPSYAGKSSRIDFLLKREEIVIEIKKTRETLKGKEIGDELIIDKERYQTHPNCKTLIAFVYDPDGYIDNPRGLEEDLSDSKGEILVKVFIRQN